MLCCAPRIAASMAGKISSPLLNVWYPVPRDDSGTEKHPHRPLKLRVVGPVEPRNPRRDFLFTRAEIERYERQRQRSEHNKHERHDSLSFQVRATGTAKEGSLLSASLPYIGVSAPQESIPCRAGAASSASARRSHRADSCPRAARQNANDGDGYRASTQGTRTVRRGEASPSGTLPSWQP